MAYIWTLPMFAFISLWGVIDSMLMFDRRVHAMEVEARLQLELAVVERTADLQEAVHRAMTADRAKAEFLGRVSHDLRAPLTSIIGNAQNLLNRAGHRERAELSAIDTSAHYLLSLIDDLVNLSHKEKMSGDLHPQPTRLQSFLEDICQYGAVLARRRNNRFFQQLPSALPPGVLVDAKRLRQILLNLLDNAAKFTQDGEIHFIVRSELLENSGVRLEFEVKDTGIGIDAAHLDYIFAPFSRLREGRDSPSGLGIGLSIAQFWACHMGGNIGAESEPGRGSRFHFSIQVPCLGDEDLPVPAGKAEQEAPASARPLAVVADDAPAFLVLMERLLQKVGCEVVCVDSGTKALAKIAERRPHLVITDQYMEDGDGWAVLRGIAESPGLGIATIMVSSSPPMPPLDWPEHLHVDAFYDKPLNVVRFMADLKDVLIRQGVSLESTYHEPYGRLLSDLEPARVQSLWEMLDLGAVTDIIDWCQRLATEVPSAWHIADEFAELARGADLAAIAQRLEAALARRH